MGIRVPRVVNGVNGYAPYQVSLVDTNLNYHVCGGSILNSFFILTAAHCLYRRSRGDKELPSKYFPRDVTEFHVIAGQYSLQWPDYTMKQVRQVEMFKVNAGYNSVTLENDIALIQLTAPLKFNQLVHPIRLPTSGREFKGNITVFGWGSNEVWHTKISEVPDILQKGGMSIMSYEECKEAVGMKYAEDVIPHLMICAQSNTTTTCVGDSGSPAVCRDCAPLSPFGRQSRVGPDCADLLCGITSWGGSTSDCIVDEHGLLISPPSPALFTKVSAFTHWISFVLHKDIGIKGNVLNYFLCDNLQYVAQMKKCDGKKDCEDESDEINCPNITEVISMGDKFSFLDEEDPAITSDNDTTSGGNIDTNKYYESHTTTQPTSTAVYLSFTEKFDTFDQTKSRSSHCTLWVCMYDYKNKMTQTDKLKLEDKLRSCKHSDGFLCPIQEICIGQHRVCDGVMDCISGIDESTEDCKAMNLIHGQIYI